MTQLEIVFMAYSISATGLIGLLIYRNNCIYEDMQFYKREWNDCADRFSSMKKALDCASQLELERLKIQNEFDEQC